MTAHELRFEVDGDPDVVSEFLPDRKAAVATDGPVEARVVASDDALLIDDPGPDRVRFDLRTGERLHVDDDACACRRRPGPAPTPEAVDVAFETTEVRREDEAGNTLRLSRASLPGWTVAVWTRRFPAGGAGVRALWRYLLPGAGADLADLGLPAEVRVSPEGRGVEEGVHLTLRSVEAVDGDVDLVPPDDYDRIQQPPRETTPPDVGGGGDRPTPGRLAGPGLVVQPVGEVVEDLERDVEDLLADLDRLGDGGGFMPGAAHGTRTRSSALGPAPEVAMVTRFDLLDTLEGVVDAVTRTFGTFDSGDDTDKMHVVADWWNQLSSSLSFGDEDETEAAIDAIKRLAVYAQVLQGAGTIDAMTSQQQQTYENEVLSEGSVRDRMLAFTQEFGSGSDSTTQDIADRFWSEATKPRTLELGPKEIEKNDVKNLVDIRFWDFDTELRVNGEPVVDLLTFGDDVIEVTLEFDELFTTFEYKSDPSGKAASILCNIVTMGGCAALQTNRGTGWLSVEDIHVALDVTRPTRNGVVEFEVSVDEDDTSTSVDFGIDTGGLGAKMADALDWGVGEVSSDVEDRFVEGLKEEVDDLSVGDLPLWPDTWHAAGGPEISLEGADVSDDEQVLGADVAQRDGLTHGRPADIDTGPVNSMGYALSEAYLTAWLREHTGLLGRDSPVEVDVEDRLDVDLPDAETRDSGDGGDPEDVGDPGCPAPALPEPEYGNKVVLQRTAPDVELPESDGDHVAEVTLEYDLTVAAVRTDHRYEKYVEPMKCYRLDGDPPRGGARPDPPPPMSGGGAMTPMMGAISGSGATFGGFTKAQMLEHTGLQVGVAPSNVAARQLAQFRHHEQEVTRSGVLSSVLTAMPSGFGGFAGGAPGPVGPAGGPVGPGGPRGPPIGPGGPGGGGGGGGVPDDPALPPDVDPFPGGDDDFPDGVPGGPGGPGGGGGGGTTYCEPPQCYVTIVDEDTELFSYLDARVEVTAELAVGFEPMGDLWFPEIALAARSGLSTEVHSVNPDAEFHDLPESDLEAFAASVAESDANDLLSPLAGLGDIEQRRQVIPDAITLLDSEIPQSVLQLLAFDQDGNFDSLRYDATTNHAYWRIEVEENLTDHIETDG